MRFEVRAPGDHPIGILDSGLGGLTIWREIRRLLPQESTVYIGDHAYMPYGNRLIGEIQNRVKRLIGFLKGKNAKIIVVACNTATVAGIDTYRRWYPEVPIIGVVPVVKTAVSMTKTKHVGVLSTPSTAASSYQRRLIKIYSDGCRVENIGVRDLVPLIEEGVIGEQVERLLRQFINSEKMSDVDVVALGCTHYPFIAHKISEIVGNEVAIIDSGGAVARQTVRILDTNRLRALGQKPYTVFYTTGNSSHVSRVATKLLGAKVRFEYARV